MMTRVKLSHAQGCGFGLAGDVAARKAAIDLCLAVSGVSPVRIEPVQGGGHSIKCSGGEGFTGDLSDFMSGKSGIGFRGIEADVLLALRERACISGKKTEGGFSFIGRRNGDRACNYNVLVESFRTPAGDAVALTINADEEDALPAAVLYRSPD